MSNLSKNIFGKKKLSDIFEEIYNNQKKKETQISALIGELKPLINDIGDATLIVPLIKEYMELGIRNDEQLIKMATIVQRALSSDTADDGNFGMTEDEKAQLLAEVKNFNTPPKTRVIPQIYFPDEYAKVKALGYEKVILTIYRWNPSALRLLITSQYLNLYAITMPIHHVWLAKFLQKLNVPVYIHTVNNQETYKVLKTNGVVNIYTDWLTEKN